MKQDFYLSAGQSVQTALRFRARSAIVNTPGGVWVGFPDSSALIAPWTAGAVVPLAAVSVANVNTTPPPGQSNSGAGAQSIVTFTDAALQPSAGTLLGPTLFPSAGLAPVLSGLVSVSGTTATILDATVPAAGPYNISDIFVGLEIVESGGGVVFFWAQLFFQSILIAQATGFGGSSSTGLGTVAGQQPWQQNFTPARAVQCDGVHGFTLKLTFGATIAAAGANVVYSVGILPRAY